MPVSTQAQQLPAIPVDDSWGLDSFSVQSENISGEEDADDSTYEADHDMHWLKELEAACELL